MHIYPYSSLSESARLLSERLGIKRLKHHNSRYTPRRGDLIINWGKGPHRHGVAVLNTPDAVERAVNKHRAFVAMAAAGVSVPPFTADKREAEQWIYEGEGTVTVVARTIVNGHEGEGIIMCDNFLDVPLAPLYTKYVKKKAEYRIHVGKLRDGFYKIIDQTQKVRKVDFEGERDTRIRNTANGYVFKRNDIQVPGDVINQAIEAVKALGLDFGAVDVIWNEHQRKAYVLECNTAPGIEGTTLENYANYFRSFMN